jgi:lysophospholipase L1-like esterase
MKITFKTRASLLCQWAFLFFLSLNPCVIGAEPTNAAEAAPAPKIPPGEEVSPEELAAYNQWKTTLSPEQLVWIKTLEDNLGDFYLRRFQKAKAKGTEDAWDYVQDDPSLPRVLLIGDSISRGYTVAVCHALAGKANVHRAPANCGPTAYGLQKLDVWVGDTKWDVIYFNFGIHDRKTDPEVYKANLVKIVDQLKKTNARLIWATTTPAPLHATAPNEMTADQCATLNASANEVMKQEGITIDDLNAWIVPRQADLQNPGDVHFHNDGYIYMAQEVSKAILNSLSQPAPVASASTAVAAPATVPHP